jgi:hypothetical protein
MSYVPTVAFLDGGIHADIVYKAFCNSVRVPFRPVSIKVMNDTGTGYHKDFVQALGQCAAQKIDIINLSIGTQQYTDFAAIATAVNSLPNTVIIAACCNENRLTFPACLPRVIGVRCDFGKKMSKGFAYLSRPYDNIEVIVGGASANSIAAPLVSAQVCEYIAQGCTGEQEIRKRLREDAVPFEPDYDYYASIVKPWEPIEVPVLAMQSGMSVPVHLLRELVDDGYRPIFLSTTEETDCQNFIFQLNRIGKEKADTAALVNLYYNFTRPDIIFIHNVPDDEYKADLTLTQQDADMTLRELEERLA